MVLGASGRCSVTLGIFVEGPSDKTTIPILIRKLGYHAGLHPRVVRQGDMLNVREMSQQIGALLRLQSGIKRILVFKDSEGVHPGETLRSSQPIAAELNRQTGGVPVDYIVVDHSLEGWLACDVAALRAVLGQRARIRIIGNPEDNPRPARLLAGIFSANGKQFKKTVDNPKIAGHVTPRNIAQKSPTFRNLASILGLAVS